MSKLNSVFRYIGSVIVAICAIALFSALFRYIATGSVSNPEPDTPDIKNLTITRETYVSSCINAANQESQEKLDQNYVTTYCGCVYDRGIAQYGYDEFIGMDRRLSETGDATELNGLINECVTYAAN